MALGTSVTTSFSIWAQYPVRHAVSRRSMSKLVFDNYPDMPITSVAAPMVAASDYAFRCLCRQYGTQLCYTQMLHSKNLVRDKVFQKNHLDLWEYTLFQPSPETWTHAQRNFFGDHYLHSNERTMTTPVTIQHQKYTTGPLVVQLAGHDAKQVVAAAQLIVEHCPKVDGIDLNCGCPQGIARKGRYGAFLMEEDNGDTVASILRDVRKSLPSHVKVSCKIRLPTSDHALRERVLKLADAGIDFMAIHGRTIHENKTKVGACHIDRIRYAVQTIHKEIDPSFPIIANGGVELYSDVNELIQGTGADAIMSSEALLETPNLFSADSSLLSPTEMLQQQLKMARDYLDWCQIYPPLPGVLGHVGGSFNVAKGHLFKFLHRYLQENSDIRDRLASHDVTSLIQAQELIFELESRYTNLLPTEWENLRSSQTHKSSWYRRHRNAGTHQREILIVSEYMASHDTVVSVKDKKDAIKARIVKLKAQRRGAAGNGSILT